MHENRDTNIEFPCDFPIKVMGKANLHFEARILSIFRKHSPDLGEAAIKIRYSKKGTYMSITATIPAKNQQQLDALYRELSADELVLMVL